MKFLLTAVNAKYIHSNLGLYSLKTYADAMLLKNMKREPEYSESLVRNMRDILLLNNN